MNSYTNSVRYAGTDSVGGNNIGISAQGGDDIKIINNISVIDTHWGGHAISVGGVGGNLSVINNIIYGINGSVNRDGDVTSIEVNTKEANPLFADAPVEYKDENYNFDFQLTRSSPAIGYADAAYSPSLDFNGILRDEHPDDGALEYVNPSAVNDEMYNDIRVYPTVFTNSVRVDRQKSFRLKIELFTIDGHKIMEEEMKPGENTKEIEVGYLKPGVYLLHAGSKTFKIIKKRN